MLIHHTLLQRRRQGSRAAPNPAPDFCLVLVAGGLLLLSELEVLATCDHDLLLGLALLALKSQGHLLRRLSLKSSAE